MIKVEKDHPMYVGVAEIAKMAGVTSAAVCNWRKRYLTFPKPVVDLRLGPVWSHFEISYWLQMYKSGGSGKLLLKDTERRLRIGKWKKGG
jgi:predicted DNA-binding transcriptional regulator AlpA